MHWNSTLYSSIDEAVGKKHGIAIIALFVQVSFCVALVTTHCRLSEEPSVSRVLPQTLRKGCDEELKASWAESVMQAGKLPRNLIAAEGFPRAAPCEEDFQR